MNAGRVVSMSTLECGCLGARRSDFSVFNLAVLRTVVSAVGSKRRFGS